MLPLKRKEKEDNRKEEKRFVPPTVDEIKKYVNEKSLKVDAEQFYNYFTEGNWVDSKGNQVKSWKQKILTWNGYSVPQKVDDKKSFNSYEQRKYDNLNSLYAN